MNRRIPREQFLMWLSQFYDFAGVSSNATIGSSFKAHFGIGNEDGVLSLDGQENVDDQELLDHIEQHYVQPPH